MRNRSHLFLLCGLCTAFASSSQAQVSAYYATQGTSGIGTTYIWQGGVQTGSYTWANPGEMPIAIANWGSGVTVRQAAGQPPSGTPSPGDEYTLSGTPTGFQNTWEGASSEVTAYDAATNGTNIFMVDWNPGGAQSGQVYSYDNNYGGGTYLFTANPEDIGITYDPVNNSLWTANFDTGLVEDWSMTGTALSSFTDANGSAAALAFDTADGTLWMSDGFGQTNIYQYSTTGTLLQTVHTGEYLLGGEMVATPEPGVFAGLGLGALVLLRRRRSVR